jgi:dihydropteroate synthase
MRPDPIDAGAVRLEFDRPIFMGVLNVTPDSFSDGGQLDTVDAAVTRARELITAGAAIIDVGGESTRPGSESVAAATQIARIAPVVEQLVRARVEAAISVDTSSASVAEAALERGATIVNDVTALSDPAMAPLVAEHRAALVLMHMRGEPRTMQVGEIVYDDVVAEVSAALDEAVQRAVDSGVARSRILVDPGIGFGKTAEHNLTLTRRLGELSGLGRPVVYGPSRKQFLGVVTGRGVEDRDRATAAACAIAVANGAHVLRVHDVAAARDAVAVGAAIRDAP